MTQMNGGGVTKTDIVIDDRLIAQGLIATQGQWLLPDSFHLNTFADYQCIQKWSEHKQHQLPFTKAQLVAETSLQSVAHGRFHPSKISIVFPTMSDFVHMVKVQTRHSFHRAPPESRLYCNFLN